FRSPENPRRAQLPENYLSRSRYPGGCRFVALVDPQENICGLAQVGATCHLCRRTSVHTIARLASPAVPKTAVHTPRIQKDRTSQILRQLALALFHRMQGRRERLPFLRAGLVPKLQLSLPSLLYVSPWVLIRSLPRKLPVLSVPRALLCRRIEHAHALHSNVIKNPCLSWFISPWSAPTVRVAT